MPDARLQRTRATLPNGYRFGDMVRYLDVLLRYEDWTRELLERDTQRKAMRRALGWNDVERGEH